jgi:RNA-directed DNA polymerase
MKESNTKGITSHCGPESCGRSGNAASEALTGEPGRPGIEPRNQSTIPDADPLFVEGRPHGDGRFGEPSSGPAGSETRRMSGRHSSGKRDTREASRSQVGPRGELQGDKAAMNATRESDSCIVPEKGSNKATAGAEAAETPEGRRLAERNPREQNTDRAQNRQTVERALERIREAVRRDISVGALMRAIIEAGARCGSSARRDLCGGCPERGIPTALSRQRSLSWCHSGYRRGFRSLPPRRLRNPLCLA